MKRFLSLFHPYGFYICYCNMDSTQLCISIAMVIGPTPPGTGVIADVCGATSSYLTSPHSFFDVICRDKLRLSDCNDQDIRRFAKFRQILCLGMCNGDRGILAQH